MYSSQISGNDNRKNPIRCGKKNSNSHTIQTSYSEKSLWKKYKNQPIPTEIRPRSMSRKLHSDHLSDEEEEIWAVVEEEQLQHNQITKRKKLPHFKVINDKGEFIGTRTRIRSQCKIQSYPQRCRSVQSLKLPQVLEEKREDDQLHRLELSKLLQILDRNEFNQKRTRKLSDSYTEIVSKVESVQMQQNYPSSILPQQILENEAQESKSVKLPNEKSIITVELQKLIVDELDEKNKRKDEIPSEIESIIEEQKNEEQIDTEKLRQSLNRFQSQSEYLTTHRDDEQFCKKLNIEEVTEIVKDGDSCKSNPQSEKSNQSSQQADNMC